MSINIDGTKLTVILSDGNEWSGVWPESEPPKGQFIYTVDSVKRWLGVDFYTHPWCRPLAEFLTNQLSLLKLALPSLKTLISSAWEMEENCDLKAIFKLLQIFARLSIAFAKSSTKPSSTVLDDRQFVMDGLKLLPDGNSHTVSKQVVLLSKMNPSISGAKAEKGQGTKAKNKTISKDNRFPRNVSSKEVPQELCEIKT